MTRRILFALLPVLLAPNLGQAAQDNFPDLPKNHWVSEALARLKRQGVLVGFPTGYHNRPASRYEVAVAVHATYVNLRDLVTDLEKKLARMTTVETKDANAGPTAEQLRDGVHRLQGIKVEDLRRLTEHFAPELTKLGVEVPGMQKDLIRISARIVRLHALKPGLALRPFPDVPPGHWASVATQRLRREGILRGYPDGRYRGYL